MLNSSHVILQNHTRFVVSCNTKCETVLQQHEQGAWLSQSPSSNHTLAPPFGLVMLHVLSIILTHTPPIQRLNSLPMSHLGFCLAWLGSAKWGRYCQQQLMIWQLSLQATDRSLTSLLADFGCGVQTPNKPSGDSFIASPLKSENTATTKTPIM